jgi:hypothetical protein
VWIEDISLALKNVVPAHVLFVAHHGYPDFTGEHYKDFDDIYGSSINEKHRPSLADSSRKPHGIYPSNPVLSMLRMSTTPISALNA